MELQGNQIFDADFCHFIPFFSTSLLDDAFISSDHDHHVAFYACSRTIYAAATCSISCYCCIFSSGRIGIEHRS